jgi:hypothetical protein
MVFSKRGFLSRHELNAWEDNIRETRPDWFSLIDDLNQEAMRICSTLHPSETDNRQLLAVMIYYRALQSFQGAVMLATRGMPADALTLVRGCAESAIALGGVALDSAFTESLIDSQNKHIKALANRLLNSKTICPGLTDEQKNQSQAVANQFNGVTLQGVNWDTLATNVGMSDLYNTVYRSTSGDAAHVTLLALDRHFRITAEGKFEKLVFQPDDRDVTQVLSMAICSLLHAMEKLNQVVMGSAITEYTQRWSKLALPSSEQNNGDAGK